MKLARNMSEKFLNDVLNSSTKMIYFEDIEQYKEELLGDYVADKDEIIEFSRKWDPQPFHIDEEVAKSYSFGGLIAPVGYTTGIINRLAVQRVPRIASLGGLGKDKVRYPNPVRPGDQITVFHECIEKRVSKSRPECGIVRMAVKVTNQDDKPVLTYETTLLVARRMLLSE